MESSFPKELVFLYFKNNHNFTTNFIYRHQSEHFLE